MDTALSEFSDKSRPPRDADLVEALGRSGTHWRAILNVLSRELSPLDSSWSFGGVDWGWTLRLRQRKRTVLYLTPCHRHFVAGFALGEKAARAAQEAGLPEAVLQTIAQAKKYAEGRAVRLDVRSKSDREAVLALAFVKMDN